MTERVAVIGMGQMGSGMAGRLTETGHDVLGYDIEPRATARVERTSSRRRGDPEGRAGRTRGSSSPACPIRRRPARRGSGKMALSPWRNPAA